MSFYVVYPDRIRSGLKKCCLNFQNPDLDRAIQYFNYKIYILK